MFDIAPSEFLLTAIVAIVVIGPKDMPLALRTAGRWIGKMRRMSNHVRSGFEAIIREAEMEEMERKWRDQNAAIMMAHPDTAIPTPDGHDPHHDGMMLPLAAPSTIEQGAVAQSPVDQPLPTPYVLPAEAQGGHLSVRPPDTVEQLAATASPLP